MSQVENGLLVGFIAKIAYESTRIWGETNDNLAQSPWDELDKVEKHYIFKQVFYCLESNPTPENSHNYWLNEKSHNGWIYGETKNIETKRHPLLVPFWQLYELEKKKCKHFVEVINLLK
jgi:hypothetical protein